MRTIKSFSKFNEEVDLNVKITDEPDLKMSKEKLNTLKKQISEYKTKKILLDKAYLTSSTDADLQAKVGEIVGKTDALPKEDRNPFLVEYLNIANLKRKVEKLGDDITKDKVKKDDFSQELRYAKEASTKEMVNKKLTDLNNRIGTNTTTIATLKKEIDDSQKKLDIKMVQIEKEMTEYIKKISSQSQK
jgi:hypothetical protein